MVRSALLGVALLLLSGCLATRDVGYAGTHPGFQDITCKGKVAITITGAVSASLAYGGAGLNTLSANGDCGDGFTLGRSQGLIGGNSSAPLILSK
jgi:hypothetical protein